MANQGKSIEDRSLDNGDGISREIENRREIP